MCKCFRQNLVVGNLSVNLSKTLDCVRTHGRNLTNATLFCFTCMIVIVHTGLFGVKHCKSAKMQLFSI